MWLRKETGGTSIGPHEWPEDGSVTEVPDELGRSLMAIPDCGFEKVDGPAPEPDPAEVPETGGGTGTEGGEGTAPGPEADGDADPVDPVPDPVTPEPEPADAEPAPAARRGRKPAQS